MNLMGWNARRAALGGLLVLSGSMAGCSANQPLGDAAQAAAIVGPHGGRAVALGENKGYAEVVVEPAPGSSRNAQKLVLAVYFLSADGKSALEPPPSSVEAAVYTPVSDTPTTVALSSDPSKPGRFVSEPGDFEYDELRGELTITVAGETIKRPFTRM